MRLVGRGGLACCSRRGSLARACAGWRGGGGLYVGRGVGGGGFGKGRAGSGWRWCRVGWVERDEWNCGMVGGVARCGGRREIGRWDGTMGDLLTGRREGRR